MTPAAQEWVDKAEADYNAALILRPSRKKHTRDIACFHLQQCLEKYLKARLVQDKIPAPRTHDLERLLDLCLPTEPLWATLRPALAALTDHAVETRYPGRATTAAEARRLFNAAAHARTLIRQSLDAL